MKQSIAKYIAIGTLIGVFVAGGRFIEYKCSGLMTINDYYFIIIFGLLLSADYDRTVKKELNK